MLWDRLGPAPTKWPINRNWMNSFNPVQLIKWTFRLLPSLPQFPLYHILIPGHTQKNAGCEDQHSGKQLKSFAFFWPCYAACEILAPRPGFEPMPPALGARSPNLTTREVPEIICFQCLLLWASLSLRPALSRLAQKKLLGFESRFYHFWAV